MLPKLDTFEIQVGSKKLPFRHSGTRKNPKKPSMWINKDEYWHWIYEFKYIDNSGGFEIEIDYQNKFVSKTAL